MAVVDPQPHATSLSNVLRSERSWNLLTDQNLPNWFLQRFYLMMLLMLLNVGTELPKVVRGADRLSTPTFWLRPPLACWLLYDGIASPEDGAAGRLTELPEEGEARTSEPP